MSNLPEISHFICAITSGSCLEKSSDFKHCSRLEVEATVEPVHRVKSLLVSTPCRKKNLRHAAEVLRTPKVARTLLPSRQT